MHILDLVPLWAVFCLTTILLLLSIEAGFQLRPLLHKQGKSEDEDSGGIMVQITLSLLAFMLVFVFGVAADRFNERRSLIIEEAAAIRTAFSRAEFLPESSKNEVQKVLREYVDLRLRVVRQPSLLKEGLARVDKMQDQLLAQTVALSGTRLDSDLGSLFVESINQVIELHQKRVGAALHSRLPDLVWLALYIMILLGMVSLGYQLGGSSRKRSWTQRVMLAFSFAIVILMIVNLDRPAEGFLKPSQKPLEDLLNKIGAPPG